MYVCWRGQSINVNWIFDTASHAAQALRPTCAQDFTHQHMAQGVSNKTLTISYLTIVSFNVKL